MTRDLTTHSETETAELFAGLRQEVCQCVRCPRLVQHREAVALRKRRAYRNCSYWGKPVPSLGDTSARLLIIGLAPGAHGANRTGRMFTGDRSGDFLYRTLHCFGFCNQPESRHREDGLELLDTFITAALHCVPPSNQPRPEELRNCHPFLVRELQLLPALKVVVTLGHIAFRAYLSALRALDHALPRPLPKFGHGQSYALGGTELISSYHPSQQNTLTGRLTPEMFDTIFSKARRIIESRGG